MEKLNSGLGHAAEAQEDRTIITIKHLDDTIGWVVSSFPGREHGYALDHYIRISEHIQPRSVHQATEAGFVTCAHYLREVDGKSQGFSECLLTEQERAGLVLEKKETNERNRQEWAAKAREQG